MRRLVLLRHGQTGWNLAKRFQGHTDVDLDEVGIAQAAAVAPVMAALRPTRLWSSDLVRARRTAEAVATACGLEVELDPRLREYDVGIRAGLTLAEFKEQLPEQYDAWTAGDGPGVEGAENHAGVSARVSAAFEDCWEALAPGEVGIVVMHGAALRTGLLAFLGWPGELRERFRGLANCGWAELTEGEDGRPQFAAYNRVVEGTS